MRYAAQGVQARAGEEPSAIQSASALIAIAIARRGPDPRDQSKPGSTDLRGRCARLGSPGRSPSGLRPRWAYTPAGALGPRRSRSGFKPAETHASRPDEPSRTLRDHASRWIRDESRIRCPASSKSGLDLPITGTQVGMRPGFPVNQLERELLEAVGTKPSRCTSVIARRPWSIAVGRRAYLPGLAAV